MTVKLIVGFRTRTVAPKILAGLTPEFEADKNLKDPEKIQASMLKKQQEFAEEAKNSPYTGTFDAVMIADPQNQNVDSWNYTDREPGGKKTPICVAVMNWILKRYPRSWSFDSHDRGRKPEVIFLGFNPRLFLKMLGEECSLPSIGKPLPLSMWYGNIDHRDIEEAIMPTECKRLKLLSVIQQRRPVDPAAAEKWDTFMTGWTQPHQYPEKDVILAVELATQLGFFNA